jgi:pimeloyl-ACP methyl ester carboxylesterase
VLFGYSEHGTKDTILWQQTVGPWRNIAKIFDDNDDAQVTRQEYDQAVQRVGRILADSLPFADLDRNKDGLLTPKDLDQRAAAQAILKAVRNRDDDYLWDHLLNLSSAGLLEEWEAPPTHRSLLQLDLPVAIFHGESDGSCRVEGVREAQAAFQKAGRTNLMVKTYPKTDHDLNWARFLRDGRIPPAFEDLFAFLAQKVRGTDSPPRTDNAQP